MQSIEMLLDSNSGRRDSITISMSPVKLKHKYEIFWQIIETEKSRNSTAHLSYKYLAFQNLSALINHNNKCKILSPEFDLVYKIFNIKTKNNILK